MIDDGWTINKQMAIGDGVKIEKIGDDWKLYYWSEDGSFNHGYWCCWNTYKTAEQALEVSMGDTIQSILELQRRSRILHRIERELASPPREPGAPPPELEPVLLWRYDFPVPDAIGYREGDEYFGRDGRVLTNVTAWQPLPGRDSAHELNEPTKGRT